MMAEGNGDFLWWFLPTTHPSCTHGLYTKNLPHTGFSCGYSNQSWGLWWSRVRMFEAQPWKMEEQSTKKSLGKLCQSIIQGRNWRMLQLGPCLFFFCEPNASFGRACLISTPGEGCWENKVTGAEKWGQFVLCISNQRKRTGTRNSDHR